MLSSLNTPKSFAPVIAPNQSLGLKEPAAEVSSGPEIGPVIRERPLSERSGVTSPPERSPWLLNFTSNGAAAARNTSPSLPARNPLWRYGAA